MSNFGEPTLDNLRDEIARLSQQLAATIAERDRAVKDAERYRWLREGDNDDYVLRCANGSPFPIMDPDQSGPAFLLRLDKLDAAIDAAIAAAAG